MSLSLDTQFGLFGHALSFPSINPTFGGLEAHDKTVKSTIETMNKAITVEIKLFITLFSFLADDRVIRFV